MREQLSAVLLVLLSNIGYANYQIGAPSPDHERLRLRLTDDVTPGGANPIAFSPDGSKIAAGCDRGFKVWDTADGKELLSSADYNCLSISFSPDGTRIAMGVWETDSTQKIGYSLVLISSLDGKEIAKTPVGINPLILKFSRDGQKIASAWITGVVVWEHAVGRLLTNLDIRSDRAAWDFTSMISSLNFNASNQILSVGSFSNTITDLDIASQISIKESRKLPGTAGDLHYGPEANEILVATAEYPGVCSLKLLDADKKLEKRSFDLILPDNETISSVRVCLSSDGALAIAIAKSSLREDSSRPNLVSVVIAVWDAKRGVLLHSRKFEKADSGLSMNFRGLSICDRGNVFASCFDGEVVVFDVLPGQEIPKKPQQLDDVDVIKLIRARAGTVDVDVRQSLQPSLVVRLGGHCTNRNLSDLTHVKDLTTLEILSSHITDEGIKELRDMERLAALHIYIGSISDIGLKELKNVNSLKKLYLRGQSFTDLGMKEVRRIPNLTSLELSSTRVSSAGLREISTHSSLESLACHSINSDGLLLFQTGFNTLVRLRLEHCNFKDGRLVGLSQLKKLETLHLFGDNVKDVGLADLKALPNLVELSLLSHQLTESGLKVIKTFDKLKSLELQQTRITDAGIKDLKEMKQLSALYLYDVDISDVGLKDLSELTSLSTLCIRGKFDANRLLKEIRNLKNLTTLRIGASEDITPEGLSDLAELENLTTLEIYLPIIADEGFEKILKLKNLESLGLDGRRITDRAFLNSAATLSKLKKLEVYERGFGGGAWLDLRSKVEFSTRLNAPYDMSPENW